MIPGGLQSDNSHQEREGRRNIFHKARVEACSAARQNRRGRGDNIGSKLKRKGSEFVIPIWLKSSQVVQHSSLLEHNGNVTALALSGKDTLVSGSRDRSTENVVDDGDHN